MYKLINYENYNILVTTKNENIILIHINELYSNSYYDYIIINKSQQKILFNFFIDRFSKSEFKICNNSNYLIVEFVDKLLELNNLNLNKKIELNKVNFPSLEISYQNIRIIELELELNRLKQK